MPMPTVRTLDESDRVALESFLAAHPSTTMILQSNLRAAGMRDDGEHLQGTYAGAFDEHGELAGVAACYWNGNVVFEAANAIPELVQAASDGASRPVLGLLGAADQVRVALAALDVESPHFDSTEILYELELSELRTPAALTGGELVARTPMVREEDLVVAWRMDYLAEAMNAEATPELEATQRGWAVRMREDRDCWLLFSGDEPVAYTAFNARTSACVQVGGVWTPPALRGRGYARAAVAASLIDAQQRGATRSLLFTDRNNMAAQRCYAGLGYRPAGDYRIVRLAPG